MEELIGAFLLLARESEAGLPVETVSINDLVADEIERARVLAEGRPVTSATRAECRLYLDAPERVLSVLLGNVLRNAFSYTDAGEVTVDIRPSGVVIRDTGVGMAPDKVREMYEPFVRGDASRRGGHGVGLTIVRRLSDRFGWPVEISSQPGVGTRVEMRFPGARAEPLEPAHGAPPPAA
jgi:signal transduction histidine kinase